MFTTIVIALLVGMLVSLPLLKWGRRNEEALSKFNPWAWGVAIVLGVVLCVLPDQPGSFESGSTRMMMIGTALAFLTHWLSTFSWKEKGCLLTLLGMIAWGLFVPFILDRLPDIQSPLFEWWSPWMTIGTMVVLVLAGFLQVIRSKKVLAPIWPLLSLLLVAISTPSVALTMLTGVLLAMVCLFPGLPVIGLARNPLLNRLTGWLFALTGVLALRATVGGMTSLRFLGSLAALFGFIGLVIPALAESGFGRIRERRRHHKAHHRFLCPHCLHFGGFGFACGKCSQDVTFQTIGNLNQCWQCRSPLFSRDGLEGVGVQAYCPRCKNTCDRSIHHERQVRVLGTLLAADPDPRCYDDGTCLTYVLNLSALDVSGVSYFHRDHALGAVELICVDTATSDQQALALELGQAADRFISQAGLTEKQRKALTVCTPQAALDPVVERVLKTRFGQIQRGVALADLTRSETPALADVVSLEVGQKATVSTLMPQINNLKPELQAQVVRRTLYGLNPGPLPNVRSLVEWLKHNHRARRRLGIRGRFLCPHCLHFSKSHRYACRICGEEVPVSALIKNACPNCTAELSSRIVVKGVGAQAYCQRCETRCDRSVHHARQARVVGILLAADSNPVCYDDGACLTYVLNLSAYDGSVVSSIREHALGAVETIWVDTASGDQQALAQRLEQAADWFIAQVRLDKAWRKALTVCVPQTTLDPAVERVLTTRFGPVKYGVALTDLVRGETPAFNEVVRVEVGQKALVSELVTEIASANSYLKAKAVETLCGLDLPAVPALVDVVDHASIDVREQVEIALAQIGSPAVPTLIAALKDGDVDRRRRVAVILGSIGSESAVPALSEALADVEIRRQAAEALGRIGGKAAASALEQADKEYHLPDDCDICAALNQFK